MIGVKATGMFLQSLAQGRRRAREGLTAESEKRVSFAQDQESSPLLQTSDSELLEDIEARSDDKMSLSGGFLSYEQSRGAIGLCALLFLTYILVAIAAFSFCFEKWPILYSAYFSVVTFTTIGFGDLTPSTPASKIFTVVFTLYGVCILGFLFGIIGHSMFEAQREASNETKRKAQQRVTQMFTLSEHPQRGSNNSEHSLPGFLEEQKPLYKEILDIVWLETPMLAFIGLVASFIGFNEGWSPVDSLYYSVIALTTVGYGDVHPDTKVSMFVNIFFLPLSVAILGEILARIAGAYINRKARQKEEEFLRRELTLSDLEAMDENLDDKVELHEFLSFMLVAMQKVDKQSIDQLKMIFYELDLTGNGALDKGDLIMLAKRKRDMMLGNGSSHCLRRSHTH